MAAKAFLDFDVHLFATQGTGPDTWNHMAKPPGLFAYAGVVTQDQTLGNADLEFSAGRTSGSTGIGPFATRAYGAIGNGQQVSLKRLTYSIGAEAWFSFDIKPIVSGTSGGAVPSGALSFFRWGDVELCVKSVTLVTSTYTMVFSVRDNAVEIATVTVPGLTTASWSFVQMHVKLDATTGMIDCTIDGVAQSAPYTGQNTVTVIALASTGSTISADHVYFGPPITNSGSVYGVGVIDNVYVDGSTFLAGRPRGDRISLSGAESLVNFAAVGTSPSTVIDSLISPTDAKAARGTGTGATAILPMASYPGTGLLTNLVGVNLYAKEPANRDAITPRYLNMGVTISGVHTMGTNGPSTLLPVSAPGTPPNLDYPQQGLFEGIYTAGITLANLASTKVRLLTS